MPEPAASLDVSSTLAALARTLDSEQLGIGLGLTAASTPTGGAAAAPFGALELSGEARYEPGATLGTGGMGRVDAIWDRDLMRELAVKQLHGRLATDGNALRQFLWEARVTARLDHPNIVPVHDLGLDTHGQLYFTMKRVRGRSLAELCEQLDALDPARRNELACCQRATPAPDEDPMIAEFGPRNRRLRAFVEICQAIAYAHERGVLHRDLKPANVMLGEFGEVLVMDWGLALPIPGHGDGALEALMPDALQASGERLIGTPRYMAPESLRGEQATVRTDVYALGVVLYELLALRRPHDATSVPALVLQITQNMSTPLAEVAPELPRSIVAVVEQAMASDPASRYASVSELIEDVEAVLDGLSPVAEGASKVVKAHRFFTSTSNPDLSHIRLLDIDLTGIAGMLFGAGVALFVMQRLVWVALALVLLAGVVFIPPLRAYIRALRSGHRRLERDAQRQQKRSQP